MPERGGANNLSDFAWYEIATTSDVNYKQKRLNLTVCQCGSTTRRQSRGNDNEFSNSSEGARPSVEWVTQLKHPDLLHGSISQNVLCYVLRGNV